MPDAFVRMRSGEKRPLYGQITAASGTLTINGAPTCTLYDAADAALPGFNNIAATGYDVGAQAAPRVWYNLDAATLSPGYYTLVFRFQALASDGMTRIYEPAIEIEITASAE
ncbi:MAG: hypothetical protein ACP5VE_10605 [Chthonomonadales bacterium]